MGTDLPVIPVHCLLGRDQWARLLPLLADGNLIFDTGGSWYHSSGLSGKGTIATHDFRLMEDGGVIRSVLFPLPASI